MVKFSLPLPSLVTSGKSLQSISQKNRERHGIYQDTSGSICPASCRWPWGPLYTWLASLGACTWLEHRAQRTELRLYQLQPGACLWDGKRRKMELIISLSLLQHKNCPWSRSLETAVLHWAAVRINTLR